MIRRSVRSRFRNVYWTPPSSLPAGPVIFACNHHGWHDGYLMFHVVCALQKRSLDWITEFDAFPLFAKVGGMPFPRDRVEARAATIRHTVRLMKEEGRSLILFAEQHLHRPPEILPIGKAVELIVRQVPNVHVIPTAIHYAMDLHERPEAFIGFGGSMDAERFSADALRIEMVRTLEAVRDGWARGEEPAVLVRGTPDVNERWDFRARFGKK